MSRTTSRLLVAIAGLALACASRADGGPPQGPDTSADAGATMEHQHGEASGPDHGLGGVGHHGPGAHGVNEQGYRGPHRFDDPELWTARFESDERTSWQRPDEVVASLGLAEDAIVADIGAGTGYFAVRLAAAAPAGRVYAVDIETPMVEWLATRAKREGLTNMSAVQGGPDGPALPEPVDLLFMCNVFHHVAEPVAYFAGLADQLRPGARVVIVDFRKQFEEGDPGPPAAMRLSADETAAKLAEAGYIETGRNLELLEHQYLLEFRRK